MHIRETGRHRRSIFLKNGPRELPQPPDLPRHSNTEASPAFAPLCPETDRIFVARSFGVDESSSGTFYRDRKTSKDLYEENTRQLVVHGEIRSFSDTDSGYVRLIF